MDEKKIVYAVLGMIFIINVILATVTKKGWSYLLLIHM